MLEQVENKIQDLQRQQKDEYYRKKEEDLVSWGLTGKKDGKKTIPIIVTDEEYEALIEASNGLSGTGRNRIASVLNVCAIAIITIGIIVGGTIFVFAKNLGIVYFSASVVISVLIALLFRGVSEAIRLLQQILDMKRTSDFKKIKHEATKVFPDTQPVFQQPVSPAPQMHFAYPDDKNEKI